MRCDVLQGIIENKFSAYFRPDSHLVVDEQQVIAFYFKLTSSAVQALHRCERALEERKNANKITKFLLSKGASQLRGAEVEIEFYANALDRADPSNLAFDISRTLAVLPHDEARRFWQLNKFRAVVQKEVFQERLFGHFDHFKSPERKNVVCREPTVPEEVQKQVVNSINLNDDQFVGVDEFSAWLGTESIIEKMKEKIKTLEATPAVGADGGGNKTFSQQSDEYELLRELFRPVDFVEERRTLLGQQLNVAWRNTATVLRRCPRYGIAILEAEPGFGKSSLCAKLVTKKSLHYFFKYDERDRSDMQTVLGTLLFQLFRICEVPDAVWRDDTTLNDLLDAYAYTQNISAQGNLQSCFSLVRHLVEEKLKNKLSYETEVVDMLVLDGLDECPEEMQINVLTFVDLCHKAMNELKMHMPIIVASRPLPPPLISTIAVESYTRFNLSFLPSHSSKFSDSSYKSAGVANADKFREEVVPEHEKWCCAVTEAIREEVKENLQFYVRFSFPEVDHVMTNHLVKLCSGNILRLKLLIALVRDEAQSIGNIDVVIRTMLADDVEDIGNLYLRLFKKSINYILGESKDNAKRKTTFGFCISLTLAMFEPINADSLYKLVEKHMQPKKQELASAEQAGIPMQSEEQELASAVTSFDSEKKSQLKVQLNCDLSLAATRLLLRMNSRGGIIPGHKSLRDLVSKDDISKAIADNLQVKEAKIFLYKKCCEAIEEYTANSNPANDKNKAAFPLAFCKYALLNVHKHFWDVQSTKTDENLEEYSKSWMNVKWLKVLAKNGLDKGEKEQPKNTPKIVKTQNRARQMRYQKNMNIAAEAVQTVFSSTKENQEAFKHKEEVLKLLRCIHSATVDVPTILDAKNYASPDGDDANWNIFWNGPSLDISVPGVFTVHELEENGSPWLLAEFRESKQTLFITVNEYSNALRTFTMREMSDLLPGLLNKEVASFTVEENSSKLVTCGSYPIRLHLVAVTVIVTPTTETTPTTSSSAPLEHQNHSQQQEQQQHRPRSPNPAPRSPLTSPSQVPFFPAAVAPEAPSKKEKKILILLDASNFKVVQHFLSPKSVGNDDGVVYVQTESGFFRMDASLKAVPIPPLAAQYPYKAKVIKQKLRCILQRSLPGKECSTTNGGTTTTGRTAPTGSTTTTATTTEPGGGTATTITIKIAHSFSRAADWCSLKPKSEPSSTASVSPPERMPAQSTSANASGPNGPQKRVVYYCESPAHTPNTVQFLTAKGRSRRIKFHVERGELYNLSEGLVDWSLPPTNAPKAQPSIATNEHDAEDSPVYDGKWFVKRFNNRQGGNCLQIYLGDRFTYVRNDLGTNLKISEEIRAARTYRVEGILGAQRAIVGDKVLFSRVLPSKANDTSSEATENQAIVESDESEAEIWVFDASSDKEPRSLATAVWWTVVGQTDLLLLTSTWVFRKLNMMTDLEDGLSGPKMDAVFAIPPTLVPHSPDSLEASAGRSATANGTTVTVTWVVGSLQVKLEIDPEEQIRNQPCDTLTSAAH